MFGSSVAWFGKRPGYGYGGVHRRVDKGEHHAANKGFFLPNPKVEALQDLTLTKQCCYSERDDINFCSYDDCFVLPKRLWQHAASMSM